MHDEPPKQGLTPSHCNVHIPVNPVEQLHVVQLESGVLNLRSVSSRHGPDTSTAVPPSMLPNRGARVSGAV